MDEKEFFDELEPGFEYDPFDAMCVAVKFNDAALFANALTRFVKKQVEKDEQKKLHQKPLLQEEQNIPLQKLLEQHPRKYKRLQKEIKRLVRFIKVYNYITEKLLHIR